mgnify:CR=1 FL=1
MIKRILVLLLTLALVFTMVACGGTKQITSIKAEKIALKDMGAVASLSQVHTHESKTENGIYYSVSITYGNQSMTYVIDNEGNIVSKAEGAHSH